MVYNSKIANILLTPFDDKSSVHSEISHAMIPKNFFEDVLMAPTPVSPFFDSGFEKITTEGERKNSPIEMFSGATIRNWIDNDLSGVFCVLGNAGAGKTTFLNMLRYIYPEIAWKYYDFFTKIPLRCIPMPGSKIIYGNCSPSSLHGRVSSAMLADIMEDFFPLCENYQFDTNTGQKKVLSFLEFYKSCGSVAHPPFSSLIYDELLKVDRAKEPSEYCIECANILARFFDENCVRPLDSDWPNIISAEESVLECVMSHYIVYLLYKEMGKKNIIVLDNFERFTNLEHIEAGEANRFIEHLRTICKHLGNDMLSWLLPHSFLAHFQFIVSMRSSTYKDFELLDDSVKMYSFDMDNVRM